MSKEAIKRSFTRAASTYSRSSYVQREVGRILVSYVDELLNGEAVERVLELGCGDGSTTAPLVKALSPSNVVLLDLSHEMLKMARRRLLKGTDLTGTNFSFVNADMEESERLFLPRAFDLVVSNSALHWVKDFRGVLEGIGSLLRPGGVFACTVFTRNTLVELSAILKETIGTTAISSEFLPSHEIEGALSSFFNPVMSSTISFIRIYKDLWSLFKNLKEVGVTPGRKERKVGILFKRDLAQMERLFQANYAGVSVRYEVVFFIGRQKGLLSQ